MATTLDTAVLDTAVLDTSAVDTWAAVCAVALGLAVLLAWMPVGRPVTHVRRPLPWLVCAGAVATLALLRHPGWLAVTVLVAVLGGAALLLWRRRSARRTREMAGRRVHEFCEALAADLAAGRPPGAALDQAAESWDVLRPVARAHGVGTDVPGAMRQLATRPGCADLALVAAAWQVGSSTGAGLAGPVARVASGIRAEQATTRVVVAELASARATARLMALLPFAALAMGSGLGDPWAFLLGTPVGLACGAMGLAVGFGGLWWIEAIADSVHAGAPG